MGFVYHEIGAALVRVVTTTCAGCAQQITVPLFHIARCDGVLICPNCGEREPLCRERLEVVAALLAGKEREQPWGRFILSREGA